MDLNSLKINHNNEIRGKKLFLPCLDFNSDPKKWGRNRGLGMGSL